MTNENITSVIKALTGKNNFLVASHINPEGDSIGSQLAIYHILKKLGKNALLFNRDSVPANLRFLSTSNLIMHNIPVDCRIDAVVILDCPVLERVGKACEELGDKSFIVNIDHHISNDLFGDVNWVEPKASSVGEMIFILAERLGMAIDVNLASFLYTAIITDTGMFNYANTSQETHIVTGRLLASGIDPKQMYSEIFEKRSASEIMLLGKVLSTLQIEAEGALAYITLTREMCVETAVIDALGNDFINFPRSIKGVEVAVFFKEIPSMDGKINVSFRSTGKIDVNMVAGKFGGGGHTQASGCVLACSLKEAQDKVLEEARKALWKI